MRGKTLLIANREGAANCMTTLKLRTGNRFTLRSVCFEIDKTWGSYLISNDTVYFKKPRGYHDEDFYEFGIIKTSSFDWNKGGQEFFLFRNKKDTSEMYLTVIENNL